MLTPEQYQQATSLIKQGHFPPSEADKHRLMDMVDEYESAHKGPKELPQGTFLDWSPSAQLAKQGEENIAAGRPNTIDQAVEAVKAGAAPAVDKLPSDAEFRRARAHLYDTSLATASQLKALAAPPEYVPPTPAGGPAHPLAEALGAMPSFAGGKVEHYIEPSLDQFRADMRGQLGDRVDQMDKSSPAYKEYSDAEWLKVYKRAQETNTPVVRHAFKDNTSWRDQVSNALHGQMPSSGELLNDAVGTVGALASGAHGADEAALGGIGGRITGTHENAEKLADFAPASNMLGSVLGVLSPNSIGGGAAGLVEGLAPKATSTLGRIALSGAKGAAASAADTAARDATAKAFGDEEPTDESELERLGKSAGLGFGIGAGADALGALLGMHGTNLRKTTPLGAAEKAGVKTSVPFGISKGPRIQALEDAGAARGNNALGQLTSEGAEKIVPAERAANQEMVQQFEDIDRRYYASDAGRTQHSAKEIFDAATEAHSENTYPDGTDLAGRSNQDFRNLINGHGVHGGGVIEPPMLLNDGEVSDALRSAQVRNPDAMVKTVDEARKMGIDVDSLLAEQKKRAAASAPMMRSTSPWFNEQSFGAAGKDKVLIVPRRMNAQQVDQIANNIDAMTINEKGQTKEAHPAYQRFQKSIRDVRDKFGPGGPISDDLAHSLEDGTVVTGWSAHKGQQADLIASMKDETQALGLAGEPTSRPDLRTEKSAQNALIDFSRGGARNNRSDQALREAANRGGVNLDEVRGVGAYEQLKPQAKLTSMLRLRNGTPSEVGHMPLAAVRLRLDPILSALGGAARGGMPGALGSLTLGRGRPKALNPSQAKALSDMLGVTGQF